MTKVVIIGGGISGLSAAYYLQKHSCNIGKIILLESSNRLGGWINSSQSPSGAIYEKGPRSLRPTGKVGKNTLSLIEDLGLENEVLPVLPSNPAAKKRFIYTKEKLHTLPDGLLSLFKTVPPFSKPFVSFFRQDLSAKKTDLADESVHHFIERRFGPEMANLLVNPLCRGIFAGDSKKLSMKSCFPDIYNLGLEHGSVIRGALSNAFGKNKHKDATPSQISNLAKRSAHERWSIYSFRRGIQQICDQMEQTLDSSPNVDIRTNAVCTGIQFTDGKAVVKTDKETLEADRIISSIYAPKMSELLAPHHKDLCDSLDRIPSNSTIVINIEFAGTAEIPKGFGYLIPSFDNGPLLGVTFDSCMFPQHDSDQNTRVTVMMGGDWYDEIASLSQADLEQMAIDALRSHLKVTTPIQRISVVTNKNCIPQYHLGHSEVVNTIEDYLHQNKLPLDLIGSSYKGVAINDCIYNAKQAADEILLNT